MENKIGETSAKISRKRRFSASAVEEQINQNAINNKKKLSVNEEHFNLLNFSDEILLIICQNLDHCSLLSLSKTCPKFFHFIYEKRLWNNVDLTAEPLMGGKLSFILRYFTEDTKTIKLQGMFSKFPLDKWKNITVSKTFLRRLAKKCPQLESLEIQQGVLDFDNVQIMDFPATIRCLIFSNCETLSPRRKNKFFAKIDAHFTNLEELSIDQCSWFETHDFISISKLKNLRLLNLNGCNTLRDCVPYCSLATRYGFKQLQILDVRNTPISDSDIQCFNVTNSLRELLLDCPDFLRNQNPNNPNSSTLRPPQRAHPESNVNNNIGLDNVIFLILRDRQVQNDQVRQIDQAENIVRNVNPERERIRLNGLDDRYQDMIHGNDDDDDDDEDDDEDDDDENVDEQNNEPVIQEDDGIPRHNRPQVNVYRRYDEMWRNFHVPHDPFYEQFIQLENNSSLFRTPPLSLISDRGICSFGQAGERIPDIVNIRVEYRSPNTYLEKLIVRNYKLVTNVTLRHLSTCSPKLKLLDVTGTSVTKDGINSFKTIKPECIIISDFIDCD